MQIRYVVDPTELGDITPDGLVLLQYCDAVECALMDAYPQAYVFVRPAGAHLLPSFKVSDDLDVERVKDVITGVFSTPHLWAYTHAVTDLL